jgi:hypothetical protein
MLDPTKRRKYVFAALDYDLDGGGPEMFTGATARSLASGLWHNDCQMPASIKNADEIEVDVQAWLDLHADLPIGGYGADYEVGDDQRYVADREELSIPYYD